MGIYEIIAEKVRQDEKIAVVTIVGTKGSSPRGVGSMMVVDINGKLLGGSIGGGQLEEKCKEKARYCIKKGVSQLASYSLDNDADGENGLDMICGGEADIFIHVLSKQKKLMIIGGGHIGLALYKFALIVGFRVTVIDEREEFANTARFPSAKVLYGDVTTILKDYDIDIDTSVVIVSHGHKNDEAALGCVVKKDAGYIGMIGSAEKNAKCFSHLKEAGITQRQLNKVHAPIGLDIGGEKPEEIALAIMAEIQAVRYGRNGGFLRPVE